MKSKILMAAVLFPVATFALAKFPTQCRVSGLRYVHSDIALFSQHTSSPRLYVFENTGLSPIWLNHTDKNKGGMGAGWASQLFPRHWSALLVTQRNFDLMCQMQTKTRGMVTVPCKKVLHACQFSQFTSKNLVAGGYWVTESVPYRMLESRIRARGFTLPIEKSTEK